MPQPRHAATPRPGAAHGAAYGAPDGGVTAEWVVARLEEAGRAVLALPHTGYQPGLRLNALTIVRSALDGDWPSAADARLRPALPDNATITRMDEAFGWLAAIPQDRYVLRRIVGARALVNPATDRHLYPWRRLGALLGADHKAIQRWHAQGVALIVASLRGG